MAHFAPFRAWRPPVALAPRVSAVPYDVVDRAEARALAAGNPLSLLHITRPDIDLADDADPHAPEAYAQGRRAFDGLLAQGGLVEDAAPGYYVYAQTRNAGTASAHTQTGVVGLVSAADYRAGVIKRHEHTRKAKEDDRKHHVESVGAHLGPVFLAMRTEPRIKAWIAAHRQGPAEVDFVAHDGTRHEVWPVYAPADLETLRGLFAAQPALYIADGHHRAAAAARVGEGAGPEEPQGRFLAVAFPHDELRILPYHRVVVDTHGHGAAGLRAALSALFEIEPVAGWAEAEPKRAQTFGLWLEGRWHRLTLRPAHAPDPADPIARLDVSGLQDRGLGPLLGIADPRTSERIDFVGGIRGLPELERRAGSTGVAFAMYPTSLDDLMAIADAGGVMPPKSTWFEPKLRSGLVVNRFGL